VWWCTPEIPAPRMWNCIAKSYLKNKQTLYIPITKAKSENKVAMKNKSNTFTIPLFKKKLI
jgi:hypothetical protein